MSVWLDFASEFSLLLLLALPLVYIFHRGSLAGAPGSRGAASLVLRCLVLACVIFALARTRLLLRNDDIAVIFVVDHSASIPAESRDAIREYIARQQVGLDVAKGDRVGLVIFGKDAGIEVAPRSAPLDLEDYATLTRPEATNLQAAVQLAVAAFPEDVGGKRLVILSDGNENVGQALDEVRSARELGVTVDVVPIDYIYADEVWIEKLIVPPEVPVGQPFDVQVVVNATREADVKVHLLENSRPVEQDGASLRLKPGKNVFEFAGLRREEPGNYSYEAHLEAVDREADTLLENNRAFGFSMVAGESKVLLCTDDPRLDRALVAALQAEKIAVDVVTPDFLPRSLEEYLAHDAIILSNVAAHDLTPERMRLFEGLVKGVGLGFVMVGGEKSFGAGGYQGTAVERLLPVSMEIRQTKKLPNGALAMVVHSCELARANYWAQRVVQQAVRVLSPEDYAGVIYYDSVAQEKWLFPMQLCAQRRLMLNRLRGFAPGDMMSFHNILQMAFSALNSVPASIKHIVILSDGDPSPPGASLVQQIIGQRITISTICYGAHGGIPPAMRQLAKDAGGRFYHLQDPDDLPELFIREATRVRKSLLLEETFTPGVVSWNSVLQGIDDLPPLDGCVLTTPKPVADLVLARAPSAEDPVADPVLALWRYGMGRTAAFTSDAGRRWAGRWTSWPAYQRFWSQLVRSVSRVRRSGPLRVGRQIDGDRGKITIDAIDSEGDLINDLQLEGSVVTPGPDRETLTVKPRQVAPGRYEAEFPVSGRGVYTFSVFYEHGGVARSYSTGVAVPYSPEYGRLAADTERLRQIAAAVGGRFVNPRTDEGAVDHFSRDFAGAYTVQEVWRQLLTLAVVLFFLDVVIRRVHIDYRAILRKLAPRRRDRAAAPAADDAELAALLRRKQDLRQETAIFEAKAPPADDDTDGASEETSTSGAAAPPASPVKPESTPAGGETRESSYTGRLLEAKRRAQRKRMDRKD